LPLTSGSSIRRFKSNRTLRVLLPAMVAIMLAAAARGVWAQGAAPTVNPSVPTGNTDGKTKAETKADQATPEKAASPDTATQLDTNAYRIGLDDALTITVWHEPELSSGVVVRPDGMITLPLINDLHVVGLKPVELQQLLTEKLKPFVSEPQVTVIVTGIKSRKAFLVGHVMKQGVFPLEGGETVLQLLATAGGLGPFAKAGSIYVLRTENNKQVRIPFKYKKALQGRSNKDDIVLQPGDVVVVP
jgi:polysaccharide biosynthesis/export protein